MSEPSLSLDKVSTRLVVAKDATYGCIETGHLLAHTDGRLCKFTLSDVETWLERGGASDKHAQNPSRRA